MKERIFWLALVLFAAIVSFRARAAQEQTTPASGLVRELHSHCSKRVGEYVGSSSYGVAFKDSSGTLRFVTHFSCGFKTPPHVALKVDRN